MNNYQLTGALTSPPPPRRNVLPADVYQQQQQLIGSGSDPSTNYYRQYYEQQRQNAAAARYHQAAAQPAAATYPHDVNAYWPQPAARSDPTAAATAYPYPYYYSALYHSAVRASGGSDERGRTAYWAMPPPTQTIPERSRGAAKRRVPPEFDNDHSEVRQSSPEVILGESLTERCSPDTEVKKTRIVS